MLLRVSVKDPDLKSSPRFHFSELGNNIFVIDYSTGQPSIHNRLDGEKHQDTFHPKINLNGEGNEKKKIYLFVKRTS